MTKQTRIQTEEEREWETALTEVAEAIRIGNRHNGPVFRLSYQMIPYFRRTQDARGLYRAIGDAEAIQLYEWGDRPYDDYVKEMYQKAGDTKFVEDTEGVFATDRWDSKRIELIVRRAARNLLRVTRASGLESSKTLRKYVRGKSI